MCAQETIIGIKFNAISVPMASSMLAVSVLHAVELLILKLEETMLGVIASAMATTTGT